MASIGPLLKQEIENTFEVIRSLSNQNELTFICPQPGCGDTKGKRSVNLKNGKTNCWRCNVGGDFLQWAKRLGFRFANAEDGGGSSLTLKQLFDIKPEVRSVLPVVAEVKLPAGFTPIVDEPDSVYTRLIGEMAVRKNLILDDFIEAGCGFTRDGKWEPFAIFPVIEYSTVVYYQGRTYAEEPGAITKKFPSNAEVKYGAKYWVYNLDEVRAKKAKKVIVVESILNVLSLRWKMRELGVTDTVAVAVFKHKVSLEQFYKLSRLSHVEEVCLLFDHDAIIESWSDARNFTNKFRITVAEMPTGEDNKKLDPNDDVDLAWKVFGERKKFIVTSGLISRDQILRERHKIGRNLAGTSFI
jgi:hypothetical protein